MTKMMMLLNPSRRLAFVLGLCVLASAGVANAETSRQGFYAGIELGFANAEDMGSRADRSQSSDEMRPAS